MAGFVPPVRTAIELMRRRLWLLIHGRSGHTGLPLAFKGLMIFGIVVIAAFLVYTTQTIVSELKASEARLANAYASQWKRAAESTDPAEIGYLFDQIIRRSDFPIVIADAQGHPMYWRGLKEIGERDTSSAARGRVRTIMEHMKSEYPPVPITYEGRLLYTLYYGNYELIRALARFPYIEVGLTGLFLLVAYVGFRNIKRAEQRYIWVGMAKETAHQLGTPLSSIMGWLEILRDRCSHEDSPAAASGNAPVPDILEKMQADTERLKRIANRFGQIGSEPDRQVQSVEPVVRETVSYFRWRLPHGGEGVSISETYRPTEPVPINAELIGWVLENLIKNALESVDSRQGTIRVDVAPMPGGGVQIAVTDNGRGISTNQQKKIFRPGFSSKKRGWGLGLTLARRIVMEYHGGDLFLDESIPNRSTRFILRLPS